VLALAVGSLIGLWLLIAPPDTGSSDDDNAGPSGPIGSTATSTATTVAEASPSPTGTAAETRYTVRAGDTLSSIAAQNNTTVDAIMRLNNLTSNVLQPGQELRIPR
jgi:LysM repeat protein